MTRVLPSLAEDPACALRKLPLPRPAFDSEADFCAAHGSPEPLRRSTSAQSINTSSPPHLICPRSSAPAPR
jgi:hypothetical protein